MGYAIGTSGADFRSRMKLQSEKVKAQVETKIKAFAISVVNNLYRDTPILTGQAKANWQVSIGNLPSTFIGLNGPSDDPRTLAHRPPDAISYTAYRERALAVIAEYKVGEVMHIYSNLPYIEKLNGGSSTQAAAGFVETAIMTAKATLRS